MASASFTNASCYIFGYALNGDGSGETAASPDPDGKPLWLHIDYSEDDSVPWLVARGIPDKVIDSLVRLDTRPRSITLEGGVLVILRTVNANPGQSPDDMVSLRIWIEQGRVITVRQRRVFSVQDIKTELEQGKGPESIQELVLWLIERVADRISHYVDAIEEQVASYEEAIEAANAYMARGEVSQLRREAAKVRRYLAPQREALENFHRQSRQLFDEEQGYGIHEQADRIIRYVEDLDLIRERCLVLQEELMNRVAQEQNSRMYVLSIVAAVFLPITFVTGLFGMNVAGLPGLEEPSAFLVVSAVMGVLVAGILVWFRTRRWL